MKPFIPERLVIVIQQLQSDLDDAAESGGSAYGVRVDFDDLNALISWLQGDPD